MADLIYNYIKSFNRYGSSPSGIIIGQENDDKNKDVVSMLIVNGICFYREYKLSKETQATCKAPLKKTYTAVDNVNKTVYTPLNEELKKTLDFEYGSTVDHAFIYGEAPLEEQSVTDRPGDVYKYVVYRCSICKTTLGEVKYERSGGGDRVDEFPAKHKHTYCKWCKKLK